MSVFSNVIKPSKSSEAKEHVVLNTVGLATRGYTLFMGSFQVLRSNFFRRCALNAPRNANNSILTIIANGVPLKKWPATVANTAAPSVPIALITLAAVPAMCPSGSMARAVKFPRVSPA